MIIILPFPVVLYLYNVQMCASIKRHRIRNRHYDINGFISQLLASNKFDELAEKVAEKAVNRILYLKEDQTPVDRANEFNKVQNNTASTTKIPPTQSEETHIKEYLRQGFAGKIDLNAVMNESTSPSENLMLKYKLIKKNALETKIQNERNTVPESVTNEESKTIEPAVDEKNDKEKEITYEITTHRSEDDIKKELPVENTTLRNVTKNDDQKVEPEWDVETKFVHNRPDGERNERSQNNYHQPEVHPNPVLDQREHIFRVKHNSAAEPEEQEAIKVDKEMKEEFLSSLDEQNRNYSPSEERTNAEAEVETTQDEPQLRAQEEKIKVGNGAYFRSRKDSIEENVVPRYETPNPYGGIDRSLGSNENGANSGSGSHERFPKEQISTEKENVDPAKPVNRIEGDKVYTYNQNSEYQDYHEKMAKWRKEHPENPADFL